MPAVDFAQWNIKIRRICKAIKQEDTDSIDQDFIDVDQLLGMYIDEFRNYKNMNLKKMQKAFQSGSKLTASSKELSLKSFQDIVAEGRKGVAIKP